MRALRAWQDTAGNQWIGFATDNSAGAQLAAIQCTTITSGITTRDRYVAESHAGGFFNQPTDVDGLRRFIEVPPEPDSPQPFFGRPGDLAISRLVLLSSQVRPSVTALEHLETYEFVAAGEASA